MAKLQPFGGYAANLLRLSEQVPARVAFLTDGKARKIRCGNQTIELRRASPRMMAAAGRTTGLVIGALRYIGKDVFGGTLPLSWCHPLSQSAVAVPAGLCRRTPKSRSATA